MGELHDDAVSPLLQVRGLELWAGSRPLLRGFELTVRPGERWCLIGRNGAGKSTLLRALAGLPAGQTAGEVLWQGRPARSWRPDAAAAHRALMGQQSSDRFSISVSRLLSLSVSIPGRLGARDVLADLDAGHLIDADASRLSGGERQRVALAQCILQGAPLMLLDEPVSFQDPAHQAVVARRLQRWGAGLPQQERQACVIAAHDVNWIARVATHVVALMGDGSWRAGRAAEWLTPDVLQDVYGCRWQAREGVLIPQD